MDKEVSVVIPTLNEEKVIGGCLKHLINQKDKPLEIIIVDNGSTDSTMEVVRRLKPKFIRKKITIKLFYYPRGNQTNARDFGVRKALGEMIGFLDADAFPDKYWISNIKKNLKDERVIGIAGKSFFRNKGWFFNFFYHFVNYYFRILNRFFLLGGGNCAFKKSAFLSVGGYNGLTKLRKEKKLIYAEDDFFLSKKLEQTGKLKFCSDLNVTLLHRIRNNQTQKSQEIHSFINTIKKCFYIIADQYLVLKYFKEKEKYKNL